MAPQKEFVANPLKNKLKFSQLADFRALFMNPTKKLALASA